MSVVDYEAKLDRQMPNIFSRMDEKSDIFDVLAYIAFALAPITRAKRVDTHRARIFEGYDEKLQHFIEFVLAQYVNEGVGELDQEKLPGLLELRYSSVHDAAERLSGVLRIRDAFIGFQRRLYAETRQSEG